MFFASLYLVESVFKWMPHSASNEPRLQLLFSVIRITLKTIDILNDNEEKCLVLNSKISDTLKFFVQKVIGERFGDGMLRCHDFWKLPEEFKVIN